MTSRIAIISTRAANTASVTACFRRCGCDCVITTDARLVRDAHRVVLPGVGSFAAGMSALREDGLDLAIRKRVEYERPLLAICLGLQLLCSRSEESPGIEGLGVLESSVQRLPDTVRVPQFGWNTVDPGNTSLPEHGYAYYANSYCIGNAPPGWTCATTEHGKRFVAAAERGPVLACQFHPELSGRWGTQVIQHWLTRTGSGVTC